MNASGWITMLTMVVGVTVFFGWCVFRVLTAPAPAETMHAPQEIDTGDLED